MLDGAWLSGDHAAVDDPEIMNGEPAAHPLVIRPFDWGQWRSLWELRHHQLAEAGIIVSPDLIPDQPEDVERDDYEWDYHHIADIYLCGAGNFWQAWWGDIPVGHIAGQDFGGAVELRHMYVREAYRRRGIGTRLVQALLDHCREHSIRAVELWTAHDGLGRRLYERMGFKIVLRPGVEFPNLCLQTNYVPGKDEIRMRFDLS